MKKEEQNHVLKQEVENIKKKFNENHNQILPILLNGDPEKAFPKFITKGKHKLVHTDFRPYLKRDIIQNEPENYYVLMLRVIKKIYDNETLNIFFDEEINHYRNKPYTSFQNGSLFNNIDHRLRDSILELVEKSGRIFMHIDDNFKGDKDIALTAVRRCPRMIKYVTTPLSSNPDFLAAASENNESIKDFLTPKQTNLLNQAKNPSETSLTK